MTTPTVRPGIAERLARMIQLPTVSAEIEQRGMAPFDAFADLLAELYPLTHEQLTLEKHTDLGLLLHWKGTGSGDPVVLMAHYDVVPVDESDAWTYPPFEGRIADGSVYGYDVLVVCPGIHLDFDATEGLVEALGRGGVSSNYRFDLAPKTWDMIRGMRSGTAVFTMPTGPVKCAGAGQKIAYLASDYWRKHLALEDIDVHLIVPGPRIFGIPAIADGLDKVIADYGIKLHTESELTAVDADARKVSVSAVGPSGKDFMLSYDMLHVVPRQSAPAWIKSSPLSTGDASGFVEVDKNTMQHVRYPNVFSLGDVASSPNAKTGAAVRKQAPVVVENIDAHLKGRPLTASYDGYSSCPIVTSSHDMLLAEFDYDMKLKPSIPLLDPAKPHRPYWYLKKFGLPWLYWNLMLKGLA